MRKLRRKIGLSIIMLVIYSQEHVVLYVNSFFKFRLTIYKLVMNSLKEWNMTVSWYGGKTTQL